MLASSRCGGAGRSLTTGNAGPYVVQLPTSVIVPGQQVPLQFEISNSAKLPLEREHRDEFRRCRTVHRAVCPHWTSLSTRTHRAYQFSDSTITLRRVAPGRRARRTCGGTTSVSLPPAAESSNSCFPVGGIEHETVGARNDSDSQDYGTAVLCWNRVGCSVRQRTGLQRQ